MILSCPGLGISIAFISGLILPIKRHSLTTDNYLIHYFHNRGHIPHHVVIPFILSCEGRCKRKDDEASVLILIVRVTKCQLQ